MKITVKYFASIREAMGQGSELLDTQAATLADLREALARGRAVRLALNQLMSEETVALTDGCEVAFFPPVTGG
jgi:molybdopterin synthase sulfur carrier subunit